MVLEQAQARLQVEALPLLIQAVEVAVEQHREQQQTVAVREQTQAQRVAVQQVAAVVAAVQTQVRPAPVVQELST